MQKTPAIYYSSLILLCRTPIFFPIFMLNSVCYVQQNLVCLVIFTDYALLSINKGNVNQHTLVASLACPIHPWICLQPFIHSYHLGAWRFIAFSEAMNQMFAFLVASNLKTLSVRVTLMNKFRRYLSLLTALQPKALWCFQLCFMKQKVDWCSSVLHYLLIQLQS